MAIYWIRCQKSFQGEVLYILSSNTFLYIWFLHFKIKVYLLLFRILLAWPYCYCDAPVTNRNCPDKLKTDEGFNPCMCLVPALFLTNMHRILKIKLEGHITHLFAVICGSSCTVPLLFTPPHQPALVLLGLQVSCECGCSPRDREVMASPE